jgi:hypothetical protein
MSASGSASSLAQAARELAVEWDQAKSHWRDLKAQEFEKTYLEPLPGYVQSSIAVMTEVELLLKKIRNDCE